MIFLRISWIKRFSFVIHQLSFMTNDSWNKLNTYWYRGCDKLLGNKNVIDFRNQLLLCCVFPIEYVILNTKIILLDFHENEKTTSKKFSNKELCFHYNMIHSSNTQKIYDDTRKLSHIQGQVKSFLMSLWLVKLKIWY